MSRHHTTTTAVCLFLCLQVRTKLAVPHGGRPCMGPAHPKSRHA
jgi:hypothetical protein